MINLLVHEKLRPWAKSGIGYKWNEQSMSKLTEYYDKYGNIAGWLSDISCALCDIILTLQEEEGVRGDLMEIGVAFGKTAFMMHLHARENETIILNDISRDLLDDVVSRMRSERSINIRSFYQSSDTIDILHIHECSVRFVHIDGDHRYQGVLADLIIADRVLSDDGILVLDDFSVPQFLGITAAYYEYAALHPGRFKMFLAGHNKAYVCRPDKANGFLKFVRDRLPGELRARGQTDFTFWWHDGDRVRCFGINQRQWDRDFCSGTTDVSKPEQENPLVITI